jgi:hypothetical protein
VLIDDRFGDACGLSDVVHGCRSIPTIGEERGGDVEEPLATFLAG